MPGQFKCEKCDRSFKMAAHLGRHMNAVHSAGGGMKRSSSGAKRGRPRRVGGMARRGNAAMLAPETPTRILADISAYRDELVARRSAIDEQIQSLESAMGMMSGGLAVPAGPARRSGRRGPGRPRGASGGGAAMSRKGKQTRAARAGSLKQMIVKVLGGTTRPLSPSEIASNVVKVGYKTTASNLTKAVSNALPQINAVKKAGRGLYRV